MKKILSAMVIGLGLISTLSAALPPFYESLVEISAILKDQRLAEKLSSGEPIVEIKKNEKGYLITTNQHELQVNIVYQKQDMPGPAKFNLEFEGAVKAVSN